MIKTIDLKDEEKKILENTWNSHISLKHLGVKIDLSDDYMVKCTIDPVQDFHRGGMGTQSVNGAVLSAIFDLVIGLVGFVNANNHRTGTVQINSNFLKPLKGNKVLVEGKLIKKGKSLVFARAEIFNENHELCAFADGITSIDFNKDQVENYMVI